MPRLTVRVLLFKHSGAKSSQITSITPILFIAPVPLLVNHRRKEAPGEVFSGLKCKLRL